MNLTCVFFGIIFIAVGLWLAFFKGYRHIPAWKAMTDDERNSINIKRLSMNVGHMISLSGGIFILKGVCDISWFIWAMIAWLVIAGLDVWFISKSRRYVVK